jgi:uncharacterized protein (DUF486 family)
MNFSAIPLTLQAVLLLVPANRIGFHQAGLDVCQFKIMQEVITLAGVDPFSVFFLNEPFKLDYLWTGFCMVGAVYFIFRS